MRGSSLYRETWKYSRLLSALGVGFLVWGLSLTGMLSPLEDFVYDHYLRLVVAVERPSTQVLLVEVDETGPRSESELCIELLRTLEGLGARKVVFTFLPPDPAELLEEAEALGGAVFGRRLVPDPIDQDALRPEPLPAEARGSGVDFAIAHILPARRGVHRRQPAWFVLDSTVHPSIEVAAALPERGDEVARAGTEFLVHFNGGAGSLPTVHSGMVREGRLIPEFVDGKTALVGRVGSATVNTPTTDSGRPMSALEFHGHAVNTLLAGGLRRPVGALPELILILSTMLLTSLLYQWTDTVPGTWIAALVLLLVASVSYVLFTVASLWVPVVEIACSQIALFVILLRNRAAISCAWATSLLVNTSSRIPERYIPATLNVRSECWPLIVNMVNQTLDLTRVVFLETIPGRTTLQEVRALNCSFADIMERRRDYQRPPYLTAIESGGPLRVEGYLKKAFDMEEQYLVPLLFGGEVLGFWACGIDARKAATVPDLEAVLRDYATLISELLQQRRLSATRRGSWRRVEAYLTHERIESLFEQLKTVLEILEGRLRQVEGLLADINTATVVYDLFGRVIHINDRMLELLEHERLQPYRMTALDLLSALSEHDLPRSRKVLRHVIMDRQSITLPVRLGRRSKSRYVMHLHPVQLNPTEKGGDALKELSGKCVLCELVDTTAFTGLFEMKEKLTERLGQQLRNDLASIDLSSSLLGSPTLSSDQRNHISQIIHDKVSRTMDVLVECQQYLTIDGEIETVERFPVSSQEALADASAAVKALIEGRDITITVDQPKLMSFVLASSDNLRAIFEAILKLLAADATDNSTIEVGVSESEDVVTCRFRNSGFGIPDDRFQEYLHGDKTLASEELKTLREGMGWVNAWGGELEARSEVGVGTEVALRLVKFI